MLFVFVELVETGTRFMKKKNSEAFFSVEVLRNYFENKCDFCDSEEDLHLHHILPRSMGGKNELANIQLICRDCHLKVHQQIRIISSPKKKRVYFCKECGGQFSRSVSIALLCDRCFARKESKWHKNHYLQLKKLKDD